MTAPEVELRATWHRVAGHQHDHLFDELCARLREPHRRYHTAVHVMFVLRHLEPSLSSFPAATADALRVAALYHDAIYDPTANGCANEAASAALAAGVAEVLGFDPEHTRLVHQLVMATCHHAAEGSPAERALTDADLAILGADPSDYDAYVNGVRAEYAHVPDAAWRTGRSAVLEGLLASPTLTARARANLTAELARYR